MSATTALGFARCGRQQGRPMSARMQLLEHSSRLADQAEAGVEGGVANIQQSLIGRRIVPNQSGVLIRKTDNHAVVIGRLAKEQLPWSERKDLSAELLQRGANLRAVAITSLWVTNGCFNNHICAHSAVLSASWSKRFACATESDGDDYLSNLFTSFICTLSALAVLPRQA